jgi:hypothetical protein
MPAQAAGNDLLLFWTTDKAWVGHDPGGREAVKMTLEQSSSRFGRPNAAAMGSVKNNFPCLAGRDPMPGGVGAASALGAHASTNL